MNSSRPPRHNFGFALSLFTAAASLATANANSVTWTTDRFGANTWADTANWMGGVKPGIGDNVVFGEAQSNSKTIGITGTENAVVGDFAINTSGYTFRFSAAGITLGITTFSGSNLSDTVFTHNRTTSAATLNLAISGTTAFTGTLQDSSAAGNYALNFTKSGLGSLDLSNAKMLYTGATLVSNGTLRVSGAASGNGILPTAGSLRVGGDAAHTTTSILEIDGKGDDSSLTRALGTGANQISLGAASGTANAALTAGFSARNGDLNINLGNAGAAIAWASNSGNMRLGVLQLGAATSTHTVAFQNGLSITGDKGIRAGDGSAEIDGDIAGAISFASGGGNSILTKDGAGTMRLSGNSDSFGGRLNVSEGKVLLDGNLESATANSTYGVHVAEGATLGGTGMLTLSNAASKLVTEGILQAGHGQANRTFTISSNVEMKSGSLLSFAIEGVSSSDRLVRSGIDTVWTFQANQQVRIIDLGNLVEGNSYQLISGLDADLGPINWQLHDSGVLSGNFVFDSGTLSFQVTAIPEPSTLVLTGISLGAILIGINRRRQNPMP